MNIDNYRKALDGILTYKLNPENKNLVQNRIDHLNELKELEIDDKMWFYLLGKLVDEGYLIHIEKNHYDITSKGVFFIKDGGYEEEFKRLNNIKIIETQLKKSTLSTNNVSKISMVISFVISAITLTVLVYQVKQNNESTVHIDEPIQVQSELNLKGIQDELIQLNQFLESSDSLKAEVQRLSMKLDSTNTKALKKQ